MSRLCLAVLLGLAMADAFLLRPTSIPIRASSFTNPCNSRLHPAPSSPSVPRRQSLQMAESWPPAKWKRTVRPKFAGGRAPTTPSAFNEATKLAPPTPEQARLTIIQITDVYTLENFPHLKTLIEEKKRDNPNTISMLTGDFLAPYLLSSIDKGYGMMRMLDATPIDYFTWGNHEADISHNTVCEHVRNYKGKWINTNMQDHEVMDHQIPYEVVEVPSADKSHTRKVGLCALLSDDPALYAQFKEPGAFGGATILDPWETLSEYQKILEQEEGCDVVVPLQHTYVPDDHRTCRDFDFPVVLSGHDHHRVDEVIEGTRLLKPGLDGIYATVLEFTWDSKTSDSPDISASFVKASEWPADESLSAQVDDAYAALTPLRNTELARVPPRFRPLSSFGSRGKVCTMGTYLCSLIRSALNTDNEFYNGNNCDCVLIMGGNIRGGKEYPDEPGYFSLEGLEAEIKPDETIGIVSMPGWLISEGVMATHSGDPIPGWFQFDEGVVEDTDKGEILMINNEPIDKDKIYRVATKVGDLTNGQSKPMTDFFNEHPYYLPPKGAYVNVHATLMAFFARNLWRRMWDAVGPIDDEEVMANCGITGGEERVSDAGGEDDFIIARCDPLGRLNKLDDDKDGVISVDNIHSSLRNVLGLRVDDSNKDLAKFVHSYADTDNDGRVTLEDFKYFCKAMPSIYEQDKWRLASPKDGARQPRYFKAADKGKAGVR